MKRPSSPLVACASWLGTPLPAAQRVTVEPAIGAPAPVTCPWISAANVGQVASIHRAMRALMKDRLNIRSLVPGNAVALSVDISSPHSFCHYDLANFVERQSTGCRDAPGSFARSLLCE